MKIIDVIIKSNSKKKNAQNSPTCPHLTGVPVGEK